MTIVHGDSNKIVRKLYTLTFRYFFTFSINVGGTQVEILGIHSDESCQDILISSFFSCWSLIFPIIETWLDGYTEFLNVDIGLGTLLSYADEVEGCESSFHASFPGGGVSSWFIWPEIFGIWMLLREDFKNENHQMYENFYL